MVTCLHEQVDARENEILEIRSHGHVHEGIASEATSSQVIAPIGMPARLSIGSARGSRTIAGKLSQKLRAEWPRRSALSLAHLDARALTMADGHVRSAGTIPYFKRCFAITRGGDEGEPGG
jgi:hypothetical protein